MTFIALVTLIALAECSEHSDSGETSRDVCLAEQNTVIIGSLHSVPRERPNVKHSIAALVQGPTTANTSAHTDVGAALAPLSSGGTKVH